MKKYDEKDNEINAKTASDPQNVNKIGELEEVSIPWCHDHIENRLY